MDRYSSLRNGLIGAWCPSLGATGYTLIDRSPYARHGALVNMGGQNNWSSRSGGLALQFDGSDDRVDLPSSITVASGTPFTVAFWAWTNNLTTQLYPHFVTLRTTSGSGPFEIAASQDSQYSGIIWGSSDGVWGRNRVALAWGSQRWNHVLLAYNGGTPNAIASYAVYLNGALQVNTTTGLFSSIGNTTVLGGVSSGGVSNRLFGFMDDVRLYDRVVAASEARLLSSQRGIGLVPTRHRRGSLLSQFWCKVSGTWKTATPWINVGGTWKKGTPKLRTGGVWKG